VVPWMTLGDMEASLDLKLTRLLDLEKKRYEGKSQPISSYPRCSEDQIEEAETVGFSWTVEEIMNGTGTLSDQNSFTQNPAAVELMAACYFSPSDLYASFGQSSAVDEMDSVNYHDLLDRQNAAWGERKVMEGIAAARAEKYETAIEYCKAALSFLPCSVEAFVCRGASYANINKNERAIKDFERALILDPSNQNASQYLRKIRDATVKPSAPTSVILPAEPVETRKPEWHVVPSKVKLPTTARDLLIKLGSSSSVTSTAGTAPQERSDVGTVNGYSFERVDSPYESSVDSRSSGNLKKRKREKSEKVKKTRKDDKKKKSRKHKDRKEDRKKEKKEKKNSD
jgi:tetratricopeptide (TPR) repeat protein